MSNGVEVLFYFFFTNVEVQNVFSFISSCGVFLVTIYALSLFKVKEKKYLEMAYRIFKGIISIMIARTFFLFIKMEIALCVEKQEGLFFLLGVTTCSILVSSILVFLIREKVQNGNS